MKVCSVCRRCYEDAALSCTEESHGAPVAARPGGREIIPGYRLDFLLAGESYRATNIALDQSFVVRITAAASEEDGRRLLEQFQSEARAVAELSHPNVAQIIESGALDGGEFYVVSEAVGGQTLRECLNNVGSLSEATAVTIARQTAQGLEAAHAVGALHRAVNPENIFLASDAENRLLVKIQNFDFGGVARQTAASGVSDSAPNLDELRYLSPEQCAGEAVDARADVYGLGIVLYEMLAGQPPFDAATAAELVEKQINEAPPPVKIASFDIRALLTHTLTLALQKSPTARLKTANAFARQLRHIEQLAAHSPIPVQASPPVPNKSAAAPIPQNKPIAPKIENSPVVERQPPAPPLAETVEAIASAPLEEAEANLFVPSEIAEVAVSATAHSVAPLPQKEILAEETPIENTPVAPPEPILVEEIETGSTQSAPTAAFVEWEQPDDVPSAIEALEARKEEFDSTGSATESLHFAEEYPVVAVPEPESIAPPAPKIEKARAAPSHSILFSDAVAASRRPLETNRPLLIGLGVAALTASIVAGAFLNRQLSRTPAPQASVVTNPPASTPLSEPENPTLTSSDAAAPEIQEASDSGVPDLEGYPSVKSEKPSNGVLPRDNQSRTPGETSADNAAGQNAAPATKPAAAEQLPAPTAPDALGRPRVVEKDGTPQKELNASLGRWVTATNARDIERQMNYYAPKVEGYYLSRNASKDSVRAEKKRIFERAGAVDIQVGKPEITVSKDGRSAKMRFRKKYVIKEGQRSRSGEVVQELRWVKSGSEWKIVSERDVKVINP